MKNSELAGIVIAALHEVAPEADLSTLDPMKSFHDQLDIDSVDFLNLMLTLEERLKLRIAEADYPLLSTLDGCVAYLGRKLTAMADSPAPNG